MVLSIFMVCALAVSSGALPRRFDNLVDAVEKRIAKAGRIQL